MICPRCRSLNSDQATQCAQCSASLAELEDDVTLATVSDETLLLDDALDQTALSPSLSSAHSPSGDLSQGQGTSTRLNIGLVLGTRYRIEAVLGEGGMGSVYKAYDVELERTVALKLIRPDLVDQPEILQRFKQELLLASRISHKNILRIHDLGEMSGRKFISMAYIEGEDLHALLKREGIMPLEQFLDLTSQMCDALEAAHSEGVVHRDLKPQNILINRSGQVFISDFGLAKSFVSAEAALTRSGQVVGTPRYISPEQVEGKPADHRSDLYALGLIFYEMTTGHTAFTGDSVFQIMYVRTQQAPPDPRALNPELPEYVVNIILRCLEKDPERRYQHAAEIGKDLRDKHTPVLPPVAETPDLPPKKRGWMMASVAALLLLVVIALAAAGGRYFLSGSDNSGTPQEAAVAQRSLVVLPFRLLQADEKLDYIAQGITETLSTKLFQLKDLRLASVESVENGSRLSPRDIGRELGVKLVVDGSIRVSGKEISISVNLEDIESEKQIWARNFSGVLEDLLTLEDRIYSELLKTLELNPDSSERARAASQSSTDFESYDLYLKGRNAMRGQQDIRNIQKAIGFFENALKTDPRFPLAFVGLADASLAMYRETKENIWAEKARDAGEQARVLNDQLPEVYYSLGSIYRATGRRAEAIAVLTRALELSPNADEGHRRLGAVYLDMGRKEESLKAYNRAIEINPYYWLNYSELARAEFQVGDYDAALSSYQKVTQLEPGNVWGHLNVGAVLFSQGKYKESIPAFEKALAIQPDWRTYTNLGTALFYLQRYDESVGMFEKAREINPQQEIIVGNLADAYRWAGQPEKAKKAYDEAIVLAFKELEVDPGNAGALASLGLYYAKKGDPRQGLNFIERARSLDGENVEYIYGEAVVRTLFGDDAKALEVLQAALEKGYSIEAAERDPELARLREKPSFKELMDRFQPNAKTP